MLSRIRNYRPLSRAFWIVIVLLSIPTIVTAASYILNSGEFIGLGPADGRIVFTERGPVDDIVFWDSNVGINLNGSPGQKLHIGDGNVLIEGGGETAIKIKRDVTYTGGPSGTSQNPIFELGRIIQAGDADPEFRFLYSDDFTSERSVFEFDRKGIAASVKPDRGSHFEGFISSTDAEPVFRLNSYPKMRLEMGNGGSTPVDVAIQREADNTMAFITGATEKVRIDATGNVGIGTNQPAYKLDVNGNAHVDGNVEVSNGYVKVDTSPGLPPIADCDASDEVGRMTVDATGSMLYICTAAGWGELTISTNLTGRCQFMPNMRR